MSAKMFSLFLFLSSGKCHNNFSKVQKFRCDVFLPKCKIDYWYWIRICCLLGGPGIFRDEELMLEGNLSVHPFCRFAQWPKNVSLTFRTPRSYMARANSGSISLSSHSTQSWQLFPITLYLELINDYEKICFQFSRKKQHKHKLLIHVIFGAKSEIRI